MKRLITTLALILASHFGYSQGYLGYKTWELRDKVRETYPSATMDYSSTDEGYKYVRIETSAFVIVACYNSEYEIYMSYINPLSNTYKTTLINSLTDKYFLVDTYHWQTDDVDIRFKYVESVAKYCFVFTNR